MKPFSETISGNKWIKASPKSAPAEKLIMYIKIFFNLLAFIESVNMPIRDIKLTIATLPNE